MTTAQQPGPPPARSGLRAIGRRWLRLLKLGLIAAAAGVVACLFGREVVLWRLPDIPEPVDAATFGVLPAADNAIPAYFAAWRAIESGDAGSVLPGESFLQLALGNWDRTKAEEARAWLAAHPGALDPWLAATRIRDASPVGTSEQNYRMLQIFQAFARSAMAEAGRRTEAGDLDGAWPYLLGAIRSGHHAGRHAGQFYRVIGAQILQEAARPAADWVDAAGQTPDRLRRAVADLAACRPLGPPHSDLVRAEYLGNRARILDPEWWTTGRRDPNAPGAWVEHLPGYPRARQFLQHEPERSLRVLRLVAAGQLAQCDRPPDERAGLAWSKYGIYQVDASTPPAVARVEPDDLAAWVDASRCRDVNLNVPTTFGFFDGSLRKLDRLGVRAAARAYALDRGEPARVYADLVPAYLDAPPAGSTAADPVPMP